MPKVTKLNQHIMYEDENFVVVGDAKDSDIGTILYNPKRAVDLISGMSMGNIYKDVDGYYYWDSDRLSGLWSSHAMQSVAKILDTLNKPWDDHLREYFEKDKEVNG